MPTIHHAYDRGARAGGYRSLFFLKPVHLSALSVFTVQMGHSRKNKEKRKHSGTPWHPPGLCKRRPPGHLTSADSIRGLRGSCKQVPGAGCWWGPLGSKTPTPN